MARLALLILIAAFAVPLAAKDSLGVFSGWAAFRDSGTPRCYAIAKPRSGSKASFASIATWPKQRIRNQVHFRMPRAAGDRGANLIIGERQFALATKGRDAWAQDRAMDAAIVAAMRSAANMRVSSRDTAGRGFTDSYSLSGAATAIDAAVLGCARR
jgi:hypothetical protein